MSFFDYKGADFMKMRSINQKSKNSYMQELSKRFNVEIYLATINKQYLEESKRSLDEFMVSCKTLPDHKPVQPPMPGNPVIPIPAQAVERLVSVLEETSEFPFHHN